jgi:DNA-binding NtrC family response regulator
VSQPLLMCVVELGGYPNFTPLYQRLGYNVETINSGRKANSTLKKECPAVVVTEFNFQHSFRDRTSNLESLLAVEQHNQGVKIIVFYDEEVRPQLEQLRSRFPGFIALAYPISEAALEAALAAALVE